MRLRAVVIHALLATVWFGQARAGVLHRVDLQFVQTLGSQTPPANSGDRHTLKPDIVFPEADTNSLVAVATPEHNGPAWNYMPITMGLTLIGGAQVLEPGTLYLVHDKPDRRSNPHPVPEKALPGLIRNPVARFAKTNETAGLPVSEPGPCLL